MNSDIKPQVVEAAGPMLDQVSFDCPACGTTHLLMRGLDFDADRKGVWRTTERPWECDCGVLIRADFRLIAAPYEEPGPE